MPTIQDLLNHASETASTLNDKGYFNQLKAMGNVASKNLKSNFPVLNSKNPTIDDIINSSLNIGGLGVIKGKFRAPTLAEMSQGWDGSKVWWHGSANKIKPSTERTPFFTTNEPEFIASQVGDTYAHAYLSKPKNLNKLLFAHNGMDTTDEFFDLLKRSGFDFDRIPGTDQFSRTEHLPGMRLSSTTTGIENAADAIYSAKVQDQLRKEGYDGVHIMDHQGFEDTPAQIWTSKPDLLPLGVAKITSKNATELDNEMERLLDYFKKQTGFK